MATRTLAICALLLIGCTEPQSVATLSWYVNPDNGSQARIAEACSHRAAGRYRIEVSVLPTDASAQREQLVRRLAARDRTIDLISIDPPFLAELARAGFLRPFSAAEASELSAGILGGALESARFSGQLYGAPFWANTQLLWFRTSVARRAGLAPITKPATWSELIAAAAKTGTTFDVQGRRYEGYMVWINALVASAGGKLLVNPEAGREVEPGIDSKAGRRAAAIIAELARSGAAHPALSTADEEVSRQSFQSVEGGFMVNWPYVYGAAEQATVSAALDRAVFDDIAWARYPRVDAMNESRPPLGGIVLGVSSYGRHHTLAVDAIRCIVAEENQRKYMIEAKLPAALASVYDDPEVRRVFPMADLVRESIETAAPRPLTPYYTDVSAATVRVFHPPAAVDPERTPAAAARLIRDVLHDRVLL